MIVLIFENDYLTIFFLSTLVKNVKEKYIALCIFFITRYLPMYILKYAIDKNKIFVEKMFGFMFHYYIHSFTESISKFMITLDS